MPRFEHPDSEFRLRRLELEAKLKEEKEARRCLAHEIRDRGVSLGVALTEDDIVTSGAAVIELLDAADRCQRRAEIQTMIDKVNQRTDGIERLEEQLRTA